MRRKTVVLLLLAAAFATGAGCRSRPADTQTHGRITLNWIAPSENEDGTHLTDLAGYRLYWGRAAGGPYPHTAEIRDPAETSFVVDGLADGDWYFVITAVSETREESRLSNEANIRIEAGAPVTHVEPVDEDDAGGGSAEPS